MTIQFKPFKTLEQKGIKKGKIVGNIFFCILYAVIAISSLFIVIDNAIELRTYTKGAEKCRVLLTEEIDSYTFYEHDNMQIVSTGETVYLNPMFKINRLFITSDYFKVGKEYDAVLFYYQGEKVVHLRWMFLLFYSELICFKILFSVASLFIGIITYKRIKYADVWKKKKVSTENYSKIRKPLVFIGILLFTIFVFIFDWHYFMIYNSFLYTIFIILSIVHTANEDYYIHLIPPGPTDNENPSAQID